MGAERKRPLPPLFTGCGGGDGGWGPRAVGAPRMAIYYAHTGGTPVFRITGDYFRQRSCTVYGNINPLLYPDIHERATIRTGCTRITFLFDSWIKVQPISE